MDGLGSIKNALVPIRSQVDVQMFESIKHNFPNYKSQLTS